MKIMGCYVQGQGHIEGSKFRLVFAHTNICKIVEPYVTKRGIAMQHCDPECHTNRLLLICCHQGQGHSEAHTVGIWLFL